MKIIFLDIDGVLNTNDVIWNSKPTNIPPDDIEKQQMELMYKKLPNLNIDDGNIQYDILKSLRHLDENLIKNLNYVIEKTEAKVVVSSAWRILNTKEFLSTILSIKGFVGEIIDFTTTYALYDSEGKCPRGLQIQDWIDKNKNIVDNFVILDDSSDMCHLSNKLVQTDSFDGLTTQDAEKAIHMLNF